MEQTQIFNGKFKSYESLGYRLDERNRKSSFDMCWTWVRRKSTEMGGALDLQSCTYLRAPPFALETTSSRFGVHDMFGGGLAEVKCPMARSVVWGRVNNRTRGCIAGLAQVSCRLQLPAHAASQHSAPNTRHLLLINL